MFDIYDPRTLNLFTDASVNKKSHTKQNNDVVAGCLPLFYSDQMQYLDRCGKFWMLEPTYQYIRKTTNNYGELYGLLLAFMYIEQMTTGRQVCPFTTFNIFSDSKISVCALRDWLPGWLRNMDENGIMYNSSGTPVANQNLYHHILAVISNIPDWVNIRISHINGHIDTRKLLHIKKAYNNFLNSNSYNQEFVSFKEYFELADDLHKANNYIDNYTRQMLYNSNSTGVYGRRIEANMPIITERYPYPDFRRISKIFSFKYNNL